MPKKQKNLYNGFKAKILRVKKQHVVMSVLEGPRKGEKRQALHAAVNVVSAPAKKAKQLSFAPAASAAGEAPAASAAGHAADPVAPAAAPAESVAPAAAPAAEDPQEDEKPDEQCMAMFGDLGMYN